MTRQEFTEKLPPFISSQLGVTPPLMFRGVSARFFPMRANLDILQQLVDSYLNIVPPEAGRFRVPVPYVYLVILDYGQMGESEMRTGWFSQVEVYFGIALEWYKRINGKWVFHDWGVNTPYIFVNDDVSVPVGRTVFGFQKVLAAVELTSSRWMKDPIAPTTLARISTTVFPKAYAGGNLETRRFLEVERTALSNMRIPVDTTSPSTPWSIASNLADAFGGFGRDALWLAQSMRLSPVNPFAGPNFIPEMLSRMNPWFAPGGNGFILNALNVKQFRRAEDPSMICYRALTNGCMQTTGFNRAGLLGESRTLLGDLSGGYSIRLYEHSSLPIAETLGLEVHRSINTEGVQISEIKPVMPFWVDVDLKFGKGANVAWQTDEGIWKDESGKSFPGEHRPDPPFNNTVSTTIEAIAGPFQFTGTTIRVIPLLADKKTLKKALDSYLNAPLRDPMREKGDGPDKYRPAKYKVRFDLWAREEQSINTGTPIGGNFAYVYLTASSFSGVISKSDNVGDWAKYELAFMIPVKWQRMEIDEWNRVGEDNKPIHDKGKWETVGVGMVPVYTLADNCITAISRLEIQGIAAGTANFVRPESVWLGEDNQAQPEQTLLRVDVELLPALGAGQQATFLPVIEISADNPNQGLGPAPDTPWHWAEDLRHELGMKKAVKQQYFEQMKVARALSLELLGNQTNFSLYTLKQFRDVTDPNKACYQSIVRVPRVLREVFDVREIEETLAVRLYGYPSMNIVEELGLQAARLDDGAAGIAYSIQGLRPFYIRTTLEEPLAERLIWRAGDDPWTLESTAFQTMLSGEEGSPRITVDMKAEALQDQMDPSRTAETMFQARQRRDAQAVLPWDDVSVPQARAAVDIIDPQTVIESILSREWSNFDPDARWRKGRQALIKGFGALPQGGPLKPFTEAELYRQINNLLAGPVGSVAAHISSSDLAEAGGNPFGNEPAQQGETPNVDIPADTQSSTLRFLYAVIDEGQTEKLIEELGNTWVPSWVTQLLFVDREQALNLIDLRLSSIIGENLAGQGAADRWVNEVTDVIQSQKAFTTLRAGLEQSIDLLSPLAILGPDGVAKAYKSLTATPTGEPAPAPTPAEFVTAGESLFNALNGIAMQNVQGEPSPHNNLDTVALAEETRLREMLAILQTELNDGAEPGDSPEAILDRARAHSTEEGEMVNLARGKCQVQFEALINKLSRAYQRPDFCLRRDAFSADDRDRLLPMALSWDKDWYYGDQIELNPALRWKVLTQNTGFGEIKSSPAESTPADESSPQG